MNSVLFRSLLPTLRQTAPLNSPSHIALDATGICFPTIAVLELDPYESADPPLKPHFTQPQRGSPMKRNSTSRILQVITPMMIVCSVLVLGTSAAAQSCSNKSIKGNYGCSIHGSLIFGPTQLPFVAATTTLYDGDGNLTGLEHAVVNGTSFDSGWDKNAGTYTVNPDCTGKSVTNSPNSPDPIINFFVVVDNGKQIYSVNGEHALSIVCTRTN